MGARAEPPVSAIGADPAAFTEFYRPHVDEATRFVARWVADPQLAADLTADVFLGAPRSLPSPPQARSGKLIAVCGARDSVRD